MMIRLMTDEEREAEFQSWWEDWASNVDMFSHGYCGYWLRGVAYSKAHDVWLVYECADDRESKDEDAILERWNAGQVYSVSLPERWALWSKEQARRAYRIGERLWGEAWLSDGQTDSSRYDVVVQLALLGEVRYG